MVYRSSCIVVHIRQTRAGLSRRISFSTNCPLYTPGCQIPHWQCSLDSTELHAFCHGSPPSLTLTHPPTTLDRASLFNHHVADLADISVCPNTTHFAQRTKPRTTRRLPALLATAQPHTHTLHVSLRFHTTTMPDVSPTDSRYHIHLPQHIIHLLLQHHHFRDPALPRRYAITQAQKPD